MRQLNCLPDSIREAWVEVDYLSCTQRYWFEEFDNYWHGWPDENRCFWTRDKEFFVQRYVEELIIQ